MTRIAISLLLALITYKSFAQVNETSGAFTLGQYYTPAGERVQGLLQHTITRAFGDAPDNYITFKPLPDAREQKLTVQEISSFVIGQDSFTVKENFNINDHDRFAKDFVRVVKTGHLNLYLHYSIIATQTRKLVLTYLVEKEGELYRMVRPAHFNEQFPLLISDNKELLQKIKAKEYKLGDLQRVVEEYNQWHAHSATSTSK